MTPLSEALTRPVASITEGLQAAPDGKWIQTASGLAFWPLDPKPEHVCIEDIAHALGMKCRYTGHTRVFYSVAQHSVIASRIVPREDALWALLHDASEAYLPDVARPVKRAMPGFMEIEDRLMQAVAERFGLRRPMPESVHHADLVLLATERRDLMSSPPYRWLSTENVTPLPERINPKLPPEAREMFLHRFGELTAK